MVADVSIQTALDQQSQTAAAKNGLAGDFTQFLTLLTVQLQNQDPLSPMETSEFTNQLVAFSQVEQSINTNDKLDSLIALGLNDSLSSAQSYVGNNINYISSEFFFGGAPQTLRYSLPQQAESATMRIYNDAGALVYEESVNTSPGAHEVTWDGRLTGGGIAADGTYEIEIDALDTNGDALQATTVVSGMVRGVESQNGQIFLLVGERAVAIGNVLNSELSENTANVTDSVTSALNYVGLDVSYDSNEFFLNSEGRALLKYTLPEDVERAKIHIYDDQGNTVYTGDTSGNKGENSFDFYASNLPVGEYTFEIDAVKRGSVNILDQVMTVEEGNLRIPYTLQDNYDSVQLTVEDSNGNVVFTDNLKRTGGAHAYTWDGKTTNGEQITSGDYKIKVNAIDDEDQKVPASSSASGRVTGVEVDNGVVFLQIGPTTVIPLSEITSVSVPDDNTQEGA